MKLRNLLILLVPLVIISLYYFLREPIIETLQEAGACSIENQVKEEVLNGILVKKYLDEKNHLHKTLTLRKDSSEFESHLLVSDLSNTYEKLEAGDSIVKAKGSLEFVVYRESNQYRFRLDFQCK